MIAVFVNVAAVILGSLIGLVARRAAARKAPSSPSAGDGADSPGQTMIMAAAGAFTLFIGVRMAFKSQREIYVILALVAGGGIGTWLGIESGILKLGEAIKRRLPVGGSGHLFAEGFLSASVLFCVGAMAVLGSINAGTIGDNRLIFIKSVLDGFLSIILASRFGIGVMFSALPVLAYQGSLTLLARWIEPVLPELALTEISGAGGVMVMMIGINLLGLKKIKTGDFLPALLLVVLLCLIDPWIGRFVTA
jgi:uncharacterized membrane protein YqgA involved in biofilm formation